MPEAWRDFMGSGVVCWRPRDVPNIPPDEARGSGPARGQLSPKPGLGILLRGCLHAVSLFAKAQGGQCVQESATVCVAPGMPRWPSQATPGLVHVDAPCWTQHLLCADTGRRRVRSRGVALASRSSGSG